MTITSVQQATASATQIIQQGNAIIAQLQLIKKIVEGGAKAIGTNPGFTSTQLAEQFVPADLAVLNTLLAALPNT